MAETGDTDTQALAHLHSVPDPEPFPTAWHLTGDRDFGADS